MASVKVIIVGGGIAGPVLAMLLKAKGYEPIIYERTEGPSEMGLRLCLQPNGLRVLALIPGLLDKVVRRRIEHIISYSALPEDERELLRSRCAVHELCEHGLEGVHRPAVLRTLIEAAQERGVRVMYDHQLVGLEQHADSVTVTFANGATDEGSFVVGCDGLHSNTRACLFGLEKATFTGLTYTGGVSPFPHEFTAQALGPLFNIYGDGFHMMGYPVNEREIAWTVTQKEEEAKESWHNMDATRQQDFKEGPFSKVPYGGGDLVRTAKHIIKYGLYDRPELTSWHKGRVVLIGDAAHPTSPHVGQGANQALEDVYHLMRLLVRHNPASTLPSEDVLSTVFTEFERLRIPRTSELVRRSRQQGETCIVTGVEPCKKRNDAMVAAFESFGGAGGAEAWKRQFGDLLQQPFARGESEI